MTKRIYHQNNALTCEAKVLDCVKTENGYEILTDATVIFPESGGQLSDTGYIGDARITHAREEGELVWHLADKAMEKDSIVTIIADAEGRLDHSQQHTGEHMLSGLAFKLFGAHNVGFHMAADYATLDLDTLLTREQVEELQREANRRVQANLPITCEIVQGEDLENIQLRKQAKGLTGDIRIVYVDGGEVDSCTCCGTHVALTGEVGYIKITSFIKYKGGTRIWFACGMRAVNDSLMNQRIVDTLAVRFSAKAEDIVAAVERQGDEIAAAKKQNRELTERLLSYVAAELIETAPEIKGVKLAFSLQKGSSMNELKKLSEKLTQETNVLAVLFGESNGSLMYQLARGSGVKVSVRELIQAVNAATGGKGGGRDDYAQGSAPITPSLDVEGTVEQLCTYCKNIIKG